MDAPGRWVIPLEVAASLDQDLVGGKAHTLGRLLHFGFPVPAGIVVTTQAYQRFLREGGVGKALHMELGRKPLDTMRWEELWDTALRLRHAFRATPLPDDLAAAVAAAAAELGEVELVVRSSAPGEDSGETSFAGLHESVVGVRGAEAVLDAVRTVWSSLWSDAALLYRRELDLDPMHSTMAVLIQPLVRADVSGVAFGRDPRQPARDTMIVEAVPGLCHQLVDGAVDPDRWILHRGTGRIEEMRAGERDDGSGPVLNVDDLAHLHHTLKTLEEQLGWPPDMEWTGRGKQLTVLQARPITPPRPAARADAADQRPWYLSLRLGAERLHRLCRRVADELIPELAALGTSLAAQNLDDFEDGELARALTERAAHLEHWRRAYADHFIPFAHGVRRLGTYYNDAVRPEDPYEFIQLLTAEERLASRRNREFEALAATLRSDAALLVRLQDLGRSEHGRTDLMAALADLPGTEPLRQGLARLATDDFDVVYEGHRLNDEVGALLTVVVQLASRPATAVSHESMRSRADALAESLRCAVGPERRAEADEVLEIARISWRLRDDDNLLLGRVESQVLRAVELAAARLRAAGRLEHGGPIAVEHAEALARALASPGSGPVDRLALSIAKKAAADDTPGVRARQLTGQPGAPGLATGPACCIRTADDLARFQDGDVLVCDAIEPSMTHLVPLASAVVERRGGMLIHGVIIARELGLPCVNGIGGLLQKVRDGQRLTVDGYLGIVTVGAATLDLELETGRPQA